MIEKSNDRVWIYDSLSKKYHLLGAGITHLKEVYKSAILETPNLQSGFCGQEVLYQKGHLEFEGFRVSDFAMEILVGKHCKSGSDSHVSLIITNRNDLFNKGSSFCYGKKIEGTVSFENPGTGEGPIGSPIKGKILYTKIPERILFDESTQAYA